MCDETVSREEATEVSNLAQTHGSGMRCLSIKVRTGVRWR
jgi:hypothetical protein